MTKAQPTTNKKYRKQFVEKDRALELATSIVDVQEKKSRAKVDKLQVSREPKDSSRRQSSSKSRLKEAMAKLSAQNKAKKRMRRAKVIGVKADSAKVTTKRVAFACE